MSLLQGVQQQKHHCCILLPQLSVRPSWAGALMGALRGVAKACLLNRVANQMGITPRVLLCRLSDLVGADIGLHVGANFHQSFPDRVYQARIIQLMNEQKRLGEKTGSGFYKFDKK